MQNSIGQRIKKNGRMVVEIAAFNVFWIIGGGGFAARSHGSWSHQITKRHNSTADYFVVQLQ